ncbi:MAG: hypothetical protein MZV70_71005 [Desulfobacterales bacterium]|nr:hypothetical protein [Desulfobacterales bacterium]
MKASPSRENAARSRSSRTFGPEVVADLMDEDRQDPPAYVRALEDPLQPDFEVGEQVFLQEDGIPRPRRPGITGQAQDPSRGLWAALVEEGVFVVEELPQDRLVPSEETGCPQASEQGFGRLGPRGIAQDDASLRGPNGGPVLSPAAGRPGRGGQEEERPPRQGRCAPRAPSSALSSRSPPP